MSPTVPDDQHGRSRNDNGQYISTKEFLLAKLVDLEKQIERVFAERKEADESKRVALESKVTEAKNTTAEAMKEAAESVKSKLDEAKDSADERALVLQSRIEKLESGGAPFASRLDDGMRKLQDDVEELNVGAVRAEVVNALKERQEKDAEEQKRQIKLIAIGTAFALMSSIILLGIRVFS